MSWIKNTEIYWLDESVRASGMPMRKEYREDMQGELNDALLHSKDFRRADILASDKRSAHDQFLTGIIVQFDLEMSIKAMYELMRYHFIEFVSSMSLQHRLTQMDLDKAFNEYVTDEMIDNMKKYLALYKANPTPENKLRLLYNCPLGMELNMRMSTNYRQLRTMYHQRRDHELPDRQVFCDRVETLPHSERITNDSRLFENPLRNKQNKWNVTTDVTSNQRKE